MTTTPPAGASTGAPTRWLVPVLGTAVATALALGGTSWVAGSAGGAVDGRSPGLERQEPGPVPVVAYALAATDDGPRLVADRREVRDIGSALRSALLETLRGTPEAAGAVPVWPDAPDLDVEVVVEGDLVEVDLQLPDGADVIDEPADASPLVGQAVAWTVATVTADDYLVVDLTVDGGDPRGLLPGVTGPVMPARDPDVLAPVTLSSIGEGEQVPSPVPLAGLATGPVAWQLLRDGREVAAGELNPGPAGTPAPYAVAVDAEPGPHVLRLVADGGAWTDSRSFTVG